MNRQRQLLRSLALLLLGLPAALAQTVYPGEQTIDKTNVPGLFVTVPVEGKQAEKDWEERLKTYGKVIASRGTYKVSTATVPALSSEPINLLSQVKTSRNAATIFVAFDLGGGNFIRAGSERYGAAERLLKDFTDELAHNQEVRLAENSRQEAEKEHQKQLKNGERLQRDIERNAREKDNLLKRIKENEEELVRLQREIETNKTDVSNALTELENRKRAVETVKSKRSRVE